MKESVIVVDYFDYIESYNVAAITDFLGCL